jgi:hypothetical protein
MNNFYVYAYVRENGTPYYIGKGKGRRAWDITHSVKVPPGERIVIIFSNITELWAFAMERKLIRWFGRKDKGTGILRNKTDGGEGSCGGPGGKKGRVIGIEARKKMSNSHKGVPRTQHAKQKISESKKGKPLSEIHKDALKEAWKMREKRKWSEESIAKRTATRKANYESSRNI